MNNKIITLILLFLPLSLFCAQGDSSLTIKGRWTLKASFSGYKSWESGQIVEFGDFNGTPAATRRLNFKLEGNYGITRFLELGFFLGIQDYRYVRSYEPVSTSARSAAPLFGVVANLHLLPIFVKEPTCHWDLYLSARYGGAILPHSYIRLDESQLLIPDEATLRHHNSPQYRHEYGIGMGVAYYFRNKIGLFGEYLIGDFSFLNKQYDVATPEPLTTSVNKERCIANFRAGITIKF